VADEDAAERGATMQLDAIVDDLEEFETPGDLAHALSGPPPLPPKKASKAMWVVGGLVVLIASGAAVGIGLFLFGGSEPAAPATEASAPAEPEPAAGEATPTEAPAPSAPSEAAPTEATGESTDVEATGEEPAEIRMDECVFESGSD